MSRITAKAYAIKDRVVMVALWVGLLGAAWSLPIIDRFAAAEERAKMESGYYYTPARPASAYAEITDAE